MDFTLPSVKIAARFQKPYNFLVSLNNFAYISGSVPWLGNDLRLITKLGERSIYLY